MTIWHNPADGTLHDDMDGAALDLPSWPQGMMEATADQIAAASQPSDEQLANQARSQRDALLSSVYDKGVLIVQRAIRLNGDADGKLAAKLHQLDEYAVALQSVPSQDGFPQAITWPTAPTEEL